MSSLGLVCQCTTQSGRQVKQAMFLSSCQELPGTHILSSGCVFGMPLVQLITRYPPIRDSVSILKQYKNKSARFPLCFLAQIVAILLGYRNGIRLISPSGFDTQNGLRFFQKANKANTRPSLADQYLPDMVDQAVDYPNDQLMASTTNSPT